MRHTVVYFPNGDFYFFRPEEFAQLPFAEREKKIAELDNEQNQGRCFVALAEAKKIHESKAA